MAPTNHAAYLDAVNNPMVVREAPYTPPSANQITIANRALAINPADYMLQDTGMGIKSYPFVLGCDVAGVVEEVGSDVTNFAPGDRVLAIVTSTDGGNAAAGFQLFTNAYAHSAAHIPDDITFEQASVLPLALLTAGTMLYLDGYHGLELPSAAAEGAPQKDTYVLVWSGASSVGATAIQLARASGYRVVTAASPHNEALCRELGAEKVFDYRAAGVADDVVRYLEGKTVAAIFDATVFKDALQKCVEIARRSEGKRRIVKVDPTAAGEYEGGVTVVQNAASMKGTEQAKKVYWEFVPQGLANGTLKPKPDPKVVGKGLEHLQAACDKLKAGVSATKLVVTL